MRPLALLLLTLLLSHPALPQSIQSNIPYTETGHPRHVLDIHHAAEPNANKPVVFWIHGGGWQTGDKTDVLAKPDWFASRGFIFVAANYRLLPDVDMETLTRDVAKAAGWVHKNIRQFGGNPNRILIGGHSAGAQLAALLCTDPSYLRTEGIAPSQLIGCLPVDGDTYDIPAIIETAETRRRAHQQPPPKFGHREKFGLTPENHRRFSAVTHIQPEKNIPPFLILYVGNHPDNAAQASRLGSALKDASLPVTLFAAKDTDHVKLNNRLGTKDDPATAALDTFLNSLPKPAPR
jgi:acetyl esterase/lipase